MSLHIANTVTLLFVYHLHSQPRYFCIHTYLFAQGTHSIITYIPMYTTVSHQILLNIFVFVFIVFFSSVFVYLLFHRLSLSSILPLFLCLQNIFFLSFAVYPLSALSVFDFFKVLPPPFYTHLKCFYVLLSEILSKKSSVLVRCCFRFSMNSFKSSSMYSDSSLIHSVEFVTVFFAVKK